MYEENLRFRRYKQKKTIKENPKVQKCKNIYNQQSKELKKNQIWDDKNKRWEVQMLKRGYLTKMVREVCNNYQDTKNDAFQFKLKNAVRHTMRLCDNLLDWTLGGICIQAK